MKKVFIIIPQALSIRNILRSGTLALLKNSGHKLYIFICCREMPEYVKQEFSDENVLLIPINSFEFKKSRIHHWFIIFTHFLILNDSTRVFFRYSRHYINRSKLPLFFYQSCLNIFSRLKFIKLFVRRIEGLFFKEKNFLVSSYFDQYNPDLVFSTSITSGIDNIFMKEAKRRGIKTLSMTKSWDNATKMYYRFIPDYFLVQNNIVKERLATLQNFPIENIYAAGFPQFDWYRKSDIFKTREEHLKSKGLDPSLPVIFFGSQGIWYKDDYTIARTIYDWIMNNELVKPCQMIVRPHFTNVKSTSLESMRGLKRVAYDDSYHVSDAFIDNWDPTVPEIVDFVNTLRHSDVIVIMLSTIALDAACFDKPIINVLFGGAFQRGKDVTDKLAKVVHYQWVFDTNGTFAVKTFDELKNAINQYLLNPQLHSEGRKQIVEKLCFGADGQSSKKIAAAINEILDKA